MIKKMKNGELLGYAQFLSTMASHKYPQIISYAIVKNTAAINKELEIYQKQFKELCDRYKDFYILGENGEPETHPSGIPKVDKEHESLLLAEITELLNFDVEVDIYTIKEDVFLYDDEKYDGMTAAEMMQLQAIMGEV